MSISMSMSISYIYVYVYIYIVIHHPFPSLASSSSLRLRDKRTRTRRGTLRTPLLHRNLFSLVSWVDDWCYWKTTIQLKITAYCHLLWLSLVSLVIVYMACIMAKKDGIMKSVMNEHGQNRSKSIKWGISCTCVCVCASQHGLLENPSLMDDLPIQPRLLHFIVNG